MPAPIGPNGTLSPYFVAHVWDSFRKGWRADFALAHASQKSGFESLSSSIPVIYPFATAFLIATCEM